MKIDNLFIKKLKAILLYDFYKNLRSLRILISFILVFAIGLILVYLYGDLFKKNSYVLELSVLYLGNTNIIPLLLGSLLTMDAISIEFEKGTFITLFSKPITKRFYYFGKLLSSILYLLMEILIFILTVFLISTAIFGNQSDVEISLLMLLGSIFVISFFAIFTFSISSMIKNSIASFFITFGLWLALDIGIGLYSYFKGFSTWMFLVPLFGESIIPYAIKQAYLYPNSTFKYYIYNSGMTNIQFLTLIIGVNIIYIILLLLVGYFVFLKSDIKEQ